MTERTITETRDGETGRYTLAEPDGQSYLTYRLDGTRMLIDYTFTPPALRGRGTAAVLVERAVADARARDWQVVPVCSYVKATIDRAPHLQDVLEKGPGLS
jgi:uncharacterized protein